MKHNRHIFKLSLMITFAIITMYALASCSSIANKNNEDGSLTHLRYPENKYQRAFEYLTDRVYEIHPCFVPNDYKYPDVKNIDRLSTDIYYKLYNLDKSKLSEQTQDLMFCYYSSKWLSKLNDGHISIYPESLIKEPALPVMLRWLGESLFVIDADSGYNDLLYKEITHINGKAVSELREKVNEFIIADNDYWRDYYNGSYMCRKVILVILGLVSDNDNEVMLSYKETRTNKNLEYTNLKFIYKSDIKLNNIKAVARNNITKYQEKKPISYELLKEYKAMYLQLNTFYYDLFGGAENDFRLVFRSIFKTIRDNDADYLIIDLRNNFGGMPEVGYQLLSFIENDNSKKLSTTYLLYRWTEYLLDWDFRNYLNIIEVSEDTLTLNNPKNKNSIFTKDGIISLHDIYIFNSEANKADEPDYIKNFYMPYPEEELRFDGEVFVLIDNQSFSMASLFASIVKDNDYGTLIGEPTGSASISHTAGISVNIPEVSYHAWISPILSVRADMSSLRAEPDAVYPDILISASIEDVINNRDPLWEYLSDNVFN